MSLSDRLGDALRTPAQKSVAYALAFGLGSLALCSVLSWIATAVAELALPSAATAAPKDVASALASGRPASGVAPAAKSALSGRGLSKTGGSKAGADRGNDSPSASPE